MYCPPSFFKSNTRIEESHLTLHQLASKSLSSISAKSPDCTRSLKTAETVWGISGDRYLFAFTSEIEDGKQKVIVWTKKASAQYLRLKTVWISNEGNILEAIASFLIEYFELNPSFAGMSSGSQLFVWLEEELSYLAKHPLPALKPKQRLLRDWASLLQSLHLSRLTLDPSPLTLEKTPASSSFPSPCGEGRGGASSPFPLSPSPAGQAGEGPIPSGKPIFIEDFREATWHKDYTDTLIRKADEVMFRIEDEHPEDLDLLEAAIRWDSEMGLADVEAGRINQQYNRQRRLVEICNDIIQRTNGKNITEEIIRINNIQAPTFAFNHAMEKESNCKIVASESKWFADYIRCRVKNLSLTDVETLLIARETNKRIQNPLSDYIKGILDGDIHLKSFWADKEDSSSLIDRLRRISMQCRALKCYHFAPETSYTAEIFLALRYDILSSRSSLDHLLFSSILTGYDWQGISSAFVKDYTNLVRSLCEHATSDTDILRLATASHLLSFIKDRETLSSEAPDREAHFSEVSTATEPALLSGTEMDRLSTLHPSWGNLAIDCFLAEKDGKTTLESFCRRHNLPIAEFGPFKETFATKIRHMVDHLNHLNPKD